MEWIERLNSAMNYIEENLTEQVDVDKLGQIACCSSFHFQRMFSYMAGMSLSEYLRRRRMSRAAVDLQGGSKVIDVALKYGYDSPTAFTRAFKGIHGITPSEVTKEGSALKAYPPISFKFTIKGDTEMDYRIEKKEAFRIVGISCHLEKEFEKNFETVPAFWGNAATNGTIPKLAGLMNGTPMGLLGVSSCSCIADEEWRYFIAVASDKPAGDFEEFEVPAATWAVFSGKGSNVSIQELEKRIVTEWLPTSGYEYGNAPDLEVYINPDPANAEYEVWIPVTRK